MNITDKIEKLLNKEASHIVSQNKTIQFYFYDGLYFYKDTRDYETELEWNMLKFDDIDSFVDFLNVELVKERYPEKVSEDIDSNILYLESLLEKKVITKEDIKPVLNLLKKIKKS
jgi:hypothetical protein